MRAASRLAPIRVPEPQEIVAWFRRLPVQFTDYLRPPETRILWGILLLAIVLRLGYLDLIPFGLPQAHNLQHSADLAASGMLPLAGTPATLGVTEPPLLSYLLLVPLALDRDPRWAAVVLALCNVAAVAGTYALGRRTWGQRVGLIAACLYAVNPWAIVIARQLTSVSLLGPLAVLLAYGLLRALADGWPWGWFIAALSLGLLLQTSWAALPLLVLAALILLTYRARVRWLHWLLGACVALIVAGPYLYHLNATRLADLGSVWRAVGSSGAGLAARLRPLALSVWLHSGWKLGELAGGAAARYQPAPLWLRRLDWVAAALYLASLPCVVIIGLRAWSHWRARRDPLPYATLGLWLWGPLLWLTIRVRPLEPGDLSILYPAGFLAMALVVDWILGLPRIPVLRRYWWMPYVQLALVAALAVLPAWQVYSTVYLNQFLTRQDTSDGFGTPLRYWLRTSAMTLREAHALGMREVWLVACGSAAEADEQPAVLNYLLRPQLEPVMLGAQSAPATSGIEAALLPAGQPGLYVLTRLAPQVEGLLRQLQAEDRGLVNFPGQAAAARALALRERPIDQALGMAQRRVLGSYDVGARLVGYDWGPSARAGQRAWVTTYWTFEEVPAQERASERTGVPRLALQLLAPDGHVFAESLGMGLPAEHWDDGRLLVQWQALDVPAAVPAGDYALRAILRRADGSLSHLLDEHLRDAGVTFVLGNVPIGR